MDDDVARRLVELNHAFYDRFAGTFAHSRARPQPGWQRLWDEMLLADGVSVLDVGCGDGRLGRILRKRLPTIRYTGVDFSGSLLDLASAADPLGCYVPRELSRRATLDDLGTFDRIYCLSVLQHIPGVRNRARLLEEMDGCLTPGGLLALANWQFLESERLRRKVRPWGEAGLDATAVEAGDYLLTWERDGHALRYAALIDEDQTKRLAAGAGLRVVVQFRSDGREGGLNLYTLLSR